MKDIANPSVNAEVETKLTDLVTRKNGISGAVVCNASGAIKAYDRNVQRGTKQQQGPFYQHLAHTCKPFIRVWREIDLGAPGRTEDVEMTRVLAAPEHVRIQVKGRRLDDIAAANPNVTHYLAVAPIDKDRTLFLVCCSFDKEYYDDTSFGSELEKSAREILGVLA